MRLSPAPAKVACFDMRWLSDKMGSDMYGGHTLPPKHDGALTYHRVGRLKMLDSAKSLVS